MLTVDVVVIGALEVVVDVVTGLVIAIVNEVGVVTVLVVGLLLDAVVEDVGLLVVEGLVFVEVAEGVLLLAVELDVLVELVVVVGEVAWKLVQIVDCCTNSHNKLQLVVIVRGTFPKFWSFCYD